MTDFSFKLLPDFITKYESIEPPFGFRDAGGNSLGEVTFLRTYSRLKPDGTKEKWFEVCERVVNGMYSIQKDWAKNNLLPWNDNKAQTSAKEAYERMFALKWTPPGRGLHQMGGPQVMSGNSSSLQNCAMVSTGDIDYRKPGNVFRWGMEVLMNGIGLGFDTQGRHKNIEVKEILGESDGFIIQDTRESWAESVGYLINGYLRYGHDTVFDYSLIRPHGSPIHGLGGTASGPAPLKQLHDRLRDTFTRKVGQHLDSELIVDIYNMIGACVVMGNVRRSAELALGEEDDEYFLDLKNTEAFPERNSFDPEKPGWAWSSNNSLSVSVGTNYENYVDRIVNNGEPGFVWLDVTKSRGRMTDPPDEKDHRVAGFNPCAEQPLESFELCTLTTVHLPNVDSKEDFMRTLKFAFLYAKTVTLMPTPWPESNSVMQRNRRIGLSITGITDVLDESGMPNIIDYMESGYSEIRRWDQSYSEWLCVRESNRVTTIKPEGTVSLLSGSSPGIHWGPGGHHYLRAIRFSNGDKSLQLFKKAGYVVEDDVVSSDTSVVYFPLKSKSHRSEKDVSMFEKIGLAAKAQNHWSDNGVSVTVSFDKTTEAQQLVPALRLHEGGLKSVSFLPMDNTYYPQMPYTQISEEDYESYVGKLKKIDFDAIYNNVGNLEAVGDKYCSNDSCTI